MKGGWARKGGCSVDHGREMMKGGAYQEEGLALACWQ